MKYKNIFIGCLLLLGVTACEKDLPTYETTVCQLNFGYEKEVTTSEITDEMRLLSHSFKLNSAEDAEVDTVWVKVYTMGYLSTENRPFSLQQVQTGKDDAVAGKHYVAFDDADLTNHFYYIPANQAEVQIPIVVKRDPSLSDGDVVLKFAFKENKWFKPGYPEFGYYTLTISDRLSKPSMWNACSLDYYFGEYGAVKHGLMIGWTDQAWDDTYINSLFYLFTYSNGATAWFPKDGNYIDYLAGWFAKRLEQENAARLADPSIGDVWREAGGNEVDFTPLEY